MTCYSPLYAIDHGLNPETGKRIVRVVSSLDDLVKPSFYVACGKCIGCRLDYSRHWADRCLLEAQMWPENYFVTLTYSDDFLPRSPVCDDNGQFIDDAFSLRKAHLSKFMKHVRKRFGAGVRFFGAGEYGDKSFRPHYHVLLFNLHLDDLVFYKRNFEGDSLYNSPSLETCWSNFYGTDVRGAKRYDKIGHLVVAPLTWRTCAYTARYVTKKLNGEDAKLYSGLNIEPPFSLMSRRPGIAKPWFDAHPDAASKDWLHISTPDGAVKMRNPRYFMRLLESSDPALFNELSEKKRRIAAHSSDALFLALGRDERVYLKNKKFLLESKLKSLDRSEI